MGCDGEALETVLQCISTFSGLNDTLPMKYSNLLVQTANYVRMKQVRTKSKKARVIGKVVEETPL